MKYWVQKVLETGDHRVFEVQSGPASDRRFIQYWLCCTCNTGTNKGYANRNDPDPDLVFRGWDAHLEVEAARLRKKTVRQVVTFDPGAIFVHNKLRALYSTRKKQFDDYYKRSKRGPKYEYYQERFQDIKALYYGWRHLIRATLHREMHPSVAVAYNVRWPIEAGENT